MSILIVSSTGTMGPKCKTASAGDTPRSRLHDSPFDNSANNLDNDSGNEASNGSKVQCTTTVSLYSPHTTKAKAIAEAETTPSQPEKEAAVLGNEENAEEEQFGDEASGSGSEEEKESADNIERFAATRESNSVAQRMLVDFLRNR